MAPKVYSESELAAAEGLLSLATLFILPQSENTMVPAMETIPVTTIDTVFISSPISDSVSFSTMSTASVSDSTFSMDSPTTSISMIMESPITSISPTTSSSESPSVPSNSPITSTPIEGRNHRGKKKTAKGRRPRLVHKISSVNQMVLSNAEEDPINIVRKISEGFGALIEAERESMPKTSTELTTASEPKPTSGTSSQNEHKSPPAVPNMPSRSRSGRIIKRTRRFVNDDYETHEQKNTQNVIKTAPSKMETINVAQSTSVPEEILIEESIPANTEEIQPIKKRRIVRNKETPKNETAKESKPFDKSIVAKLSTTLSRVRTRASAVKEADQKEKEQIRYTIQTIEASDFFRLLNLQPAAVEKPANTIVAPSVPELTPMPNPTSKQNSTPVPSETVKPVTIPVLHETPVQRSSSVSTPESITTSASNETPEPIATPLLNDTPVPSTSSDNVDTEDQNIFKCLGEGEFHHKAFIRHSRLFQIKDERKYLAERNVDSQMRAIENMKALDQVQKARKVEMKPNSSKISKLINQFRRVPNRKEVCKDFKTEFASSTRARWRPYSANASRVLKVVDYLAKHDENKKKIAGLVGKYFESGDTRERDLKIMCSIMELLPNRPEVRHEFFDIYLPKMAAYANSRRSSAVMNDFKLNPEFKKYF